jgi:hypothetical protein
MCPGQSEEDTDDGDSNFSKPTAGWPGGQIQDRDLRERRVGDDGEVHDQSGQIEEKVGRGIGRFGEIKRRIVRRLVRAGPALGQINSVILSFTRLPAPTPFCFGGQSANESKRP